MNDDDPWRHTYHGPQWEPEDTEPEKKDTWEFGSWLVAIILGFIALVVWRVVRGYVG